MRKTAAVSALSCCIALCVCIMCASCTHYTATVADNFSVDYSTQTEITTEQTTVSVEQAISSSTAEKPLSECIAIPDFEYTKSRNSGKNVEIKITSDLTNVDEIKVYYYSFDSKDKKNINFQLVGDFFVNNMPEDKTVSVSASAGKKAKIVKDNSAVKCGFSGAGYRICTYSNNKVAWSEYKPVKMKIDIKKIIQYTAKFKNFTACGAANGLMAIQPADKNNSKNTQKKLDEVRNYSKNPPRYSLGKKMDYCMNGDNVVNSVNDYLKKENITSYSLENFDELTDKPAEIARQFIDTGRVAMFDVQYQNGKIRTKSPYSHWITVNGYEISDDGKSYKYSWVNSMEYGENQWVSENLLNKSVQGTVDNRDFSYYKITEKQAEELGMDKRRNIVALQKPLVNSFIE